MEVEGARELVVGFGQDRVRLHFLTRILLVDVILKFVDGTLRPLIDPRAIFLPDARQFTEQMLEPDASRSVLRRIVGAAVKRLQLRCEEDAHRPAAVTRRRLDVGHVGEIHVGALLAVHLDGDEMFVDQRCDLLVLKGLPFHHVAPVTGGIPGRQKDRFVLHSRLHERRVAPRKPIHRIVGMLKKVRTLLVDQGVRMRGWGLVSGVTHESFKVSNVT